MIFFLYFQVQVTECCLIACVRKLSRKKKSIIIWIFQIKQGGYGGDELVTGRWRMARVASIADRVDWLQVISWRRWIVSCTRDSYESISVIDSSIYVT